MKKIRFCHLFSGVGSPEMALDKLDVNYEHVGFSEIDKFAIKSYLAIHGNIPALGSVEDIKELPECDMLVYGSPCQDFSIGGTKLGLVDEQGNKTRSGLLLDVERLLDKAKADGKLPRILVMENVKNLVGKQFKPCFDKWLEKLDELGYNNYWKILNAKDFGVPQNRERVFVVSILKEYDTEGFTFPEPFELETRLKDLLEDEVPESYYLEQKTIDKIVNSNFHSERDRIMKGDVCYTLRARDYKDPICVKEDPKVMQVANYLEGEGNYWKNPNNGRIYSGEGLAPTLNCMEGGNRQPKVWLDGEQVRVRKLTERECWRLMGFSDEDVDKVKAVGISKSQMYKQAGNSIVVDVLYHIFSRLNLNND